METRGNGKFQKKKDQISDIHNTLNAFNEEKEVTRKPQLAPIKHLVGRYQRRYNDLARKVLRKRFYVSMETVDWRLI